jgi:hypothetical protein
MKTTLVLDPSSALTIVVALLGLSILTVSLLYYALKSKRIRVTNVYLSGEPESVVSSVTPSVSSMYWGFMKRFAKSIYRVLVEGVHTGSLHDWYRFLSSWLALLVLLAVIVFIASIIAGW